MSLRWSCLQSPSLPQRVGWRLCQSGNIALPGWSAQALHVAELVHGVEESRRNGFCRKSLKEIQSIHAPQLPCYSSSGEKRTLRQHNMGRKEMLFWLTIRGIWLLRISGSLAQTVLVTAWGSRCQSYLLTQSILLNPKLSRFLTQLWSRVLTGAWAMSFQKQFIPLMNRVGMLIRCNNGDDSLV